MSYKLILTRVKFVGRIIDEQTNSHLARGCHQQQRPTLNSSVKHAMPFPEGMLVFRREQAGHITMPRFAGIYPFLSFASSYTRYATSTQIIADGQGMNS
jgi:hypothetical protein